MAVVATLQIPDSYSEYSAITYSVYRDNSAPLDKRYIVIYDQSCSRNQLECFSSAEDAISYASKCLANSVYICEHPQKESCRKSSSNVSVQAEGSSFEKAVHS